MRLLTNSYICYFILNFSSATLITVFPTTVTKDSSVALTCNRQELDPYDITYTWFKNGRLINLKTPQLTIRRASLSTRGNYTCVTNTESGISSQATIALDVKAPPAFISKLPYYYGVRYDIKKISLRCRIECYPLCSIKWLENGRPITSDTSLYYVENQALPADLYRNDFESVESTLVWNLANWPNQQLGKYASPKMYTCVGESGFGRINSSVVFAVEYPPERLSLSTNRTMNVKENEIPSPVECSGQGKPALSYLWKNSATGELMSKSDTLHLGNISRQQTHSYVCEASNKHGVETIDLNLNVLYKPNCILEVGNLTGQLAVICRAYANPMEVTFEWQMDPTGSPNNVVTQNMSSYLILGSGKELRNYKCLVSNSLGVGAPCEKTVSDPVQVKVSGESKNITEGSTTLLECHVLANFEVEILWYNGTDLVRSNNKTTIVKTVKDTVSTSGTLEFTATRWDNGLNFTCFAKNDLIHKYRLPVVQDSVTLEVFYRPVVTVTLLAETKLIEGKNQEATFLCEYSANPMNSVTISWYKNSKVLKRVNGKHLFDNLDQIRLKVRNVTREDMGTYGCQIQNAIGSGVSESVFLDVNYPPSAEVVLSATSLPENSFKLGNVTLTCKVLAGKLSKVNWYIDDHVVDPHSLPGINAVKNIIVSDTNFTMTLTEVEENFSANFSCQGMNPFSNGSISKRYEIKMTYPDIPTKVQQNSMVLKGQKASLRCSVDDVEAAENLTYVWYRDGYKLAGISTSEYTPVASMDARRNISCVATTLKRTSTPASISVDIVAPPAFISRPNRYKGVLRGQDITLTCRIECYPLCSVEWFVEGERIRADSIYQITEETFPANIDRNDFESVESNLTFPSGVLDEDKLSNYTCTSVQSEIRGADVAASTLLALDFPPEYLTLSKPSVVVKEGEFPQPVECKGAGRPSLRYLWKRTSSNEVVSGDGVLSLPRLSKVDEGNYTCEGWNKYGNRTATIYFQVTDYKPICSISTENLGLRKSLRCDVTSDSEASVTWTSESVDGTVETLKTYDYPPSHLVVNSSLDPSKTYVCVARNFKGASVPCRAFLPVPPPNTTISNTFVEVKENQIPVSLNCTSEWAGPVNYIWRKNSTAEIVSESEVLQLGKMSRADGGYYTCEAKNQFGTGTANAYLNVLYGPSCKIERDANTRALVCTGEGNPSGFVFTWWVDTGDDYVRVYDNVVTDGGKSTLLLQNNGGIGGVYTCSVKNEVEESKCFFEFNNPH